MEKRKVTTAVKKQVAGRQRFTCAANIPDYKCPLRNEPFDEAGFEIDHIKPLSEGGSNEPSNLQALCLMCHRVKSNRASISKSKENTLTTDPVINDEEIYIEKYDAIAKFMDEKISPWQEGDPLVQVDKPILRRVFKHWKDENDQRHNKKLSVSELEKRIELMYGCYPRGGWTNFKLEF